MRNIKNNQIISGWTLTNNAKVNIFNPKNVDELKEFIIRSPARSIISRGLGRSYGDAAQLSNATIIKLDEFNKIEIDTSSQTITVGAGVSFSIILEKIIPKGFFLPVVAGTSNISIGGAIAADVHGKNHHIDGSFGNFLEELTLIDGKGIEHRLSPSDQNKSSKFWATVGGMGLTGVIIEATIKLLPISTAFMKVDTKRVENIDLLMSDMEISDEKYRYSVAWIDCLNNQFRGVLTCANHAILQDLNDINKKEPLKFLNKPKGNFPNMLGLGIINKFTISAFNSAWYYKSPENAVDEIQTITSYFHPLDAIKDWNKLYGSKGFLQYQFVVPLEHKNKIKDVLKTLKDINAPSFMTVLKRFGKANQAPLSFPSEGWTLAIDIPNSVPNLFDTLNKLDIQISNCKGKIYLAKDSRQSADMFKKTYPFFEDWIEIKKELDPDCKFVSDISNRLDFFKNF